MNTSVAYNVSPTRNKGLLKLENHLLKQMGKAMADYSMLGESDSILAAVSGGKDSLAMLRLLLLKRKQLPAPKKYRVVAAHVHFDLNTHDPSSLEKLFEEYGVEYRVARAKLPARRDDKMSECFWCAWNRRKILFNLAAELGCGKVALAHHLDDTVETLLMNQFFYGEISTMPPNISLFEGKLHIIRPLAYIPEKTLAEYSSRMDYKPISCTCPFAGSDKRRKYVKALIADVEKRCHYVKVNLFRSMRRIKEEYLA